MMRFTSFAGSVLPATLILGVGTPQYSSQRQANLYFGDEAFIMWNDK
jgi:hypothetical protein